MATLAELQTVMGDPILKDKCRAAAIKTAVSVVFESDQTPNHANRLKWAKQSLSDPVGMAEKVVRYVVAARASDTLAQISALDDATIQANVDASLAVFADGS